MTNERPYIVFRFFRILEKIFGRQPGIKAESAWSNDGAAQFYTLEAALMHIEGCVRKLTIPSFSRVHIPALSFGNANMQASLVPGMEYLFAISAPTVDDANLTGLAAANPPSVSLTPSGTDRLMLWYMHAYSNGSGQTGSTASATFNTSESATSCGTALTINNAGGLGEMSMWYRVAPTATTANATVSITNSQGGGALKMVIYSGCAQSSPINAYNSVSATGTNASLSVTTTVDNSWVTGFQENNGVAVTVGSGCSKRRTDGGGDRVLDSGSAITPAGAFNINWSHSSVPYGVVASAISPATATASYNYLSLLGAGQ